MPPQILNAEQVSLLAAHFPRRNDSSYSIGQALSTFMLVPRLRAQYGVSVDENFDLYDHSGQGRTLTYHNPLPFQTGITPYVNFIGAGSDYYTRPTEAGLEIEDALSCWTWVRFHAASTGAATGNLCKWRSAAGARSYKIHKTAGNLMTFSVSGDGAATTSVAAVAGDYVVDRWKFLFGRFTASTELALFVGDGISGSWTKYTNVAAIPAAIFVSAEPFEVGRDGDLNYFDGTQCLWGLGAYSVTDQMAFAMFHNTRPMYMW